MTKSISIIEIERAAAFTMQVLGLVNIIYAVVCVM